MAFVYGGGGQNYRFNLPLASGLLGGIQSGADAVNQATLAGADRDKQVFGAQQDAAQAVQQGMNDTAQVLQQTAPVVHGLLGDTPAARTAQQSIAQGALSKRYGDAITGYKQAWADANAAGDVAGMQAASEGANVIRDAAQSQGVDISAYDANRSLSQAKAASQAAELKAYAQLFGGDSPTPDEFFANRYAAYRNNGAKAGDARQLAGEDAAQYQAKWLADRSMAAYAYGLDDDNVINKFGAQVMDGMRGTDPTSIGLLNAYFAKPVNRYTELAGERARDKQLARTMNLGNFQEGIDEKKMGYANNLAQQNAAQQYEYQKGLLGAKADADIRVNDAKADAGIRGLNAQAELMAKYPGSSSSGSKKGGGSSGGSSGGKPSGFKVSDATAIQKLYDDWNEKNPDAGEWSNPYKDALDNATAALNGYSEAPADVDDYDSVASWAQNVVEENARRGYPATAEELAEMIASVGGYGPDVAQQFADSGALSDYGR